MWSLTRSNTRAARASAPIWLLFGTLGVGAAVADGREATDLSLGSPAFAFGSEIPSRYTCDGADVSPALVWTEVPAEARSLVLIMDDPDAPDPAAPRRTWVHWVLFNLPSDSRGLDTAVSREDLPPGTREGRNDWNRTGYGGPCPPIGRHRYYFKLYALDEALPHLRGPSKGDLEAAMNGHVLAEAVLIGTYERNR